MQLLGVVGSLHWAACCKCLRQMTATFNAVGFVTRIKQGELDGRLVEELRKLSEDELEEVVGLIVEERLKPSDSDESRVG
jgi:hypothetical protein